jgi:hypothetical protein
MIVRSLNGLGVVADRKRNIKSGKEFDAYFPKPEYSNPVLHNNGTNELTIDKLIPEMVRKYSKDTERITVVLKQPTLEATLKAVWDFIYTYIQYELDSPYEEQIRRPARMWADRKGDCDCYTTFISSVLTNLRIPHYLRMAAYNRVRGYQHIYVVVPKTEGATIGARDTYFVVDPVLNSFNEEKPFLFKHDKFIAMARGLNSLNGFPIRMLNGDVQFSNRNDLAHNEIYYSPALKTWALKGLDGGFYINADPLKRFIEPLNGFEPMFYKTGVGLNGGLFKKIVKGALKIAKPFASLIPGGSMVTDLASGLVNKIPDKKSKGGATSAAPTAVQAAEALAPLTALPASVSVKGGDSSDVISKIVASNKAQVMSLNTINEGLKSKISTFSDGLTSEIKKVIDDGQNLKDTTANLKNLAISALTTTANVKQQTAEVATQNVEILNSVKSEQLKSEQFRTEQTSTNRITLIALVAVGVLLVYIAVKQSNN